MCIKMTIHNQTLETSIQGYYEEKENWGGLDHGTSAFHSVFKYFNFYEKIS